MGIVMDCTVAGRPLTGFETYVSCLVSALVRLESDAEQRLMDIVISAGALVLLFPHYSPPGEVGIQLNSRVALVLAAIFLLASVLRVGARANSPIRRDISFGDGDLLKGRTDPNAR